jgi:uncharacterized membrane protein YbhN (UPF0104 family)
VAAVRETAIKVGRAVFAIGLTAVLVLAAIDNWGRLRDVELQPQPGWALAAVPFTFVGGIALPLAWRHVLYAYGHAVDRASALRIWCLSQASRFVPTGAVMVASRVTMTAGVGVPRSVASASVAIELGLMLLWGAFYASWLPSYRLDGWLRGLLAVATVAALAALPWLFRVIGRFLPRFPAIAPTALRVRHLYEAIALYGVNDLVRCIGFFFVAASLHTVDRGDVFLITAAVNVSVIIGMIGITPAGLGVREGVLTALLAPRFGTGNAAAMSVAFRAWDFLFELVWIGIAVTWERRSRPSLERACES